MEPSNKKYDGIYEPAEDSKLLLKYSLIEIKKLNKKLDVIEIGVGSGFVISNIQKKNPNNNYFGTDINQKAIEFTKNENSKINLKLGNLFENYEDSRFDLILFNTPYFPIEDGEKFQNLSLKDRAIYGGKKGFETICEFIIKSKNNFKKEGIGIMIFSSLSNLDVIKKTLEENLFEFEILEEQNSFFEKIYCVKFYPLKILKKLEEKNIKKIKFLAKGKHSIVLEGKFNKQTSIIKIGKEKDIQIENEFLKKLEKESFIPKLFLTEKTYCVREKIKGINIAEFLLNSNKKETEIIINKILEITYRLDELKINKSEMTNPYKHIFIDLNLNVKMIDYERCLFTNKPKNTTQFFQYIKRNSKLLKEKNIEISNEKILEIAKKYKNKIFEITLENLK